MTKTPVKTADNLQKGNKGAFKPGYDPRRWMQGRPRKPKDKKKAEELLEHVIWEVLSEAIKNPKTGEEVDRLRAMIRSMTTSRQSADKQAILDRIAGKVTHNVDVTSGVESVAVSELAIPAEMLAPDFMASHRAILSGKFHEFCEFGGRGSTKSSFISLEIVRLIANDPTAHALAMRQVAESLRISVFDQLIWAFEELGLGDKIKKTTSPLEITYLPTGQRIYFRGADDPMKIKSIKPSFGAVKILWLEETNEFHGDEIIRNITQSAIRGTDEAYIFKSWNPPRTSGNWINKYIQIPKDGQWQHKSDYRNVPLEWLGKIFIDEAEWLKSVNFPAYEHEYLGAVNGIGDMVFENLEIREITDDEIKKFDNILHGLDFGYHPHPAHYTKVHYDATHHVLYVFGEVRKWKHSNEAMYQKIIESGLYTNEQLLICDSAVDKDVQDYRSYGARARGAEKGAGSVNYSIKWMQSLVSIVVDPIRCPYTVEELTDYAYERTKDGEIIDAYPRKKDDALASIRYATNLHWRRPGE